MKISKEQKEKNRKALLKAAVELMAKEGVKATAMSKIAQRAGLSEPVIYKYFPSKDDLVAAYFLDAGQEAVEKVTAQKDFSTLSLFEQIHLFIDAQLSIYEKHKPFVAEAHRQIFRGGLAGSLSFFADQKTAFSEFFGKLLDAAVAAGEIPAPPARSVVVELMWDFQLGLMYYWQSDDSEGSMKTLELLDKSLHLFADVLKIDVLGKMMDLVYFFAREHLLKAAPHLGGLSSEQKKIKTRFLKEN